MDKQKQLLLQCIRQFSLGTRQFPHTVGGDCKVSDCSEAVRFLQTVICADFSLRGRKFSDGNRVAGYLDPRLFF